MYRLSIFAQEYLAQLDPRVMFDVLGSGKVPKELEARGITFDMVKSYADKTMQRTSWWQRSSPRWMRCWRRGVSGMFLLFLLFLGLKLTSHIAWSWVWVTAPLWLPMVVVLAIILFVGLIALIVGR